MIQRILTREKGQGLTEYALILVLVAIVVIVVLALLGPAVGNVFSNVVAAIETVGGGGPVISVDARRSGPIVVVTVRLKDGYGPGDISVSATSGSVSFQNCGGDTCTYHISGAAETGTATASGGLSSKSDTW